MEKTNYTISFSPAADAVDVDLPASKSISNRALTIAAMADGCSIGNIADCDDTNAMRRALLTQSAQANVNIGAAGTAMRFLTAYFASQPWRSVLLDGTPRMRMIRYFVKSFTEMSEMRSVMPKNIGPLI